MKVGDKVKWEHPRLSNPVGEVTAVLRKGRWVMVQWNDRLHRSTVKPDYLVVVSSCHPGLLASKPEEDEV